MKRRNKRVRKYVRACGGSIQSCKKHGPVRELVSPESRKLACSRRLVGARSDHVRSAFGARSDHARSAGPLARQREGFARFELRGRRSTFARSGSDFVAGAALSQGQVVPRFCMAWQGQHFRKVRFRFRGRRSTFARSSCRKVLHGVAGAALSKGQVQILWQAQHFRKVKYRFRVRRSTFARSSADFVAGAALSQV